MKKLPSKRVRIIRKNKNTHKDARMSSRLVYGLFILIFALGGVYLLTRSNAEVVPVSTCGKRVAGYNYKRPFGNSAINTPICELPKWSRSDDMVNRLNNNAYITGYLGMKVVKPGTKAVPMNKLDFKMQFGLEEGSGHANDYSIPVYKASDATQQVRVRLNSAFAIAGTNIGGDDWANNNSGYDWGKTIPWNPSWRPSAGNDSQMTIIDEVNGTEIDLWGVSRLDIPSSNNVSGCLGDINNLLFRGGYDANVDLCVATAYIIKTPNKETADYRTYEGNYPHSTGVGLQSYAGLITPEEVMAGEIRHASKFTPTNTMFGPECPKNIDINDPAIGNTCGVALAPAGQFEKIGNYDGMDFNPVLNPSGLSFATGNTPDEKRAGTVPEGMRFGLNITDAEINSWLDSRGYTGRKRETARIFAVAMRDYGLIVTDSGGGGAIIQVQGGRNSDTAKKWRDLGIEGDGTDLLFGLFTKDKMYVAEPATNTCADNSTTRYWCHAKKTGYTIKLNNDKVTINGEDKPVAQNIPPTVKITSPTKDLTVKGSIIISSNILDSDGTISKVELLVDSKQVQTSKNSPYSFTLNTLELTNSTHTISVKVTDNKGASGADSINIKVDNTVATNTNPKVNKDDKTNKNGESATKPKSNSKSPPRTENPKVKSEEVKNDFNSDGKVDFRDFWTVLTNLGNKVPAYTSGDCNGDGNVSFSDLLIVMRGENK